MHIISKKKEDALVYKQINRQLLQYSDTTPNKTYVIRQYLFINNFGYYKLRNFLRSLMIFLGGAGNGIGIRTKHLPWEDVSLLSTRTQS